MSTDPLSGFFGKLPARGDFVARSLPPGFRDVWDGWLSRIVAESRHWLDGGPEGRWGRVFAAAPVWRFALGPDVAGPQALCGLLVPSIDNAGRAFPLTLVTLSGDGAGNDWFDRAEAMLLDVLDRGGEPEELAAALAALPAAPRIAGAGQSSWWVGDHPPTLHAELPDTQAFVAMLTGGAVLFPIRSAGATDPGTVRTLNEDAMLDRPDLGLWAVADGLGGLDAGDQASRLVIDRLGAIGPATSAQALLHEVGRILRAANAELHGASTAMACTLVALLVFGRHFAAVWAGDSRLYRLRAGALEQLTTDHSVVQAMVEAGDLEPSSAVHHPRGNEVTRAVGAADTLFLDVIHGELAPGDLFLLCSDGLTKVLPDTDIGRIAESQPLDRLPAQLISVVREIGAPDNVTVVAVELASP
ncbi:type VI secretion system-associated protein TagF [Azospirillum rugosum]|uniref:Type VI secretion system ImpM family protein n=1 Tax=Azospirillum rugosum TaxID=416170 RepID=A0ABS4SLW5_9PROT|nr:type VI secretion system-associated protein TagF [Azospirillum rugosum]MBP2293224.1 type VI secretion system ImpM family protein [Azospirillum rugosum]